jgi:hypothetical protein
MPKPRGKANKPVKPVMHIFCEGAKTEPFYFKGYLNRFHSGNRRLKVVEIEESKKNTPVQLVEEAVKLKKESPENDVFWTVYDRESTQKYSDALHQKALNKAVSHGIKTALSNVCFEIWILLHFTDSTAPYQNYDDLIRNSSLTNELKELGIEKYDKADQGLFLKICNNIPEARERAKKMNAAAVRSASEKITENSPHLLNPFTQVHELLDAIDNIMKLGP